MRFQTILAVLFLSVPAYSQSIVTPVFVHKDGEASVSGYSGSEKGIYVDGSLQQSVGWMTFQAEGVDVTKIAAAKLALYVQKLGAPGALGVYGLTVPVTAPEKNVPLSLLKFGTTALASITIGTAEVEKILLLDITAAVKSGTFYGIALVSDDGLKVTFDSKEANSDPVILLTHNVENVAAKWLSGAATPVVGLGKDGDYYLNTASGDVSAKTGEVWSVVTNIVGATGTTGAKGDKGANGDQGIQGIQGIQGPKGDPGTSSWIDGAGTVQTTARVGVGKVPTEELDVTGTVRSDTVLATVMRYSTPQTRYFSIGGEAFMPRTNINFSKGFGMGGAYITAAGNQALVAPVNLPHGAIIRNFTAFFYDTSTTQNMEVSFYRFTLNGGVYSKIHEINSSTVSGYGSVTSDTATSFATVNNQNYSYSILAIATWDSNNLIMRGVTIVYTVNQPE